MCSRVSACSWSRVSACSSQLFQVKGTVWAKPRAWTAVLKTGQAAPRCEGMCPRGEVEDEAGDLLCIPPEQLPLSSSCEESRMGSLISKIPSGAHGLILFHLLSNSSFSEHPPTQNIQILTVQWLHTFLYCSLVTLWISLFIPKQRRQWYIWSKKLSWRDNIEFSVIKLSLKDTFC